MNPRIKATKIILSVINKGHSLTREFETPLIQEISFGVIRWYTSLKFIAEQLLEKPLKEKDSDVFVLILIGLYQLIYMRTPEHAAVSETVEGCAELKKPWAKNLVNAILRNYQRDKENLLEKLNENPETQYAHPQWLIEKIKEAYPDQWTKILNENNSQAPLSLRVNMLQTTRENYMTRVEAFEDPFSPAGLTLVKPMPVAEITGFKEGYVSVQGLSSQLIPSLLELAPDQRILDACAAPGGKTAHIIESQPDIEQLVAIDIDEARTEKIKENIKRLDLESPQIITADATQTNEWWDKKPFDRILVDAPCSATGIIRRHPDIKVLRRESDIKQFAEQQLNLLNSLWPLLKEGGILLYSTCSILPEENQGVIKQFLSDKNDAEEIPIFAEWGIKQEYGRQILTHGVLDGFYFAKIKKNNQPAS